MKEKTVEIEIDGEKIKLVCCCEEANKKGAIGWCPIHGHNCVNC